jgi:hypothetical protein
MASNTLNDDLKIRWNAKRSRYLQKRSGFRNIPDRAFDLGALSLMMIWPVLSTRLRAATLLFSTASYPVSATMGC